MKRILLVDDEPLVIRVMKLALSKDGYQIDTAVNGEDALKKIAAACPDVLVTDIEMPRMSGKELCQHIQAEMPNRKFPIFVSTSLTATEHRKWSAHVPNLTFLEKPISVRKLRSLIGQALEANNADATEAVS